MVNDLKALLRENVAAPPPEHLDLDALVGAGRRRVRGRRTAGLGGAALVAVGAVAVAAIGWPSGSGSNDAAAEPPRPDAPTIRLADAEQAVEGEDYRVLASYTNEDLDSANGQYFDGVTDDGLILFRDGPHGVHNRVRLALRDPATGENADLPDLPGLPDQTWPLELGTDRLVLLGGSNEDGGEMESHLVASIFDRTTGQWSTTTWPTLPALTFPSGELGPDGRLYVSVPATTGEVPEGGWPTGPDGEAEDADAEGDTFHLWSVSLSDGTDVRDEGLTVGQVAFTDTAMVWTDSTNGAAGRVHVRDLTSGDEHSFDPHLGERCNLLSFGATEDRVVLGQYCGTYAGGVRDDRVQILSTDGEQVVTLQGNGVDGWIASPGSSLVTVTAHKTSQGSGSGTYVYDLGTDRFLRLSDAVSSWGLGGPTPAAQVLWGIPVNHGRGATQLVGELLP